MKESNNYIEGFHVSRIRKFFRNSLLISRNRIQSDLRISQEWTDKIIQRLQELNYINKKNINTDNDLTGIDFGVTEQGLNFGLEYIKPIKRENADQIFSKFLNRVKIVNESSTYLFSVNKLKLFGSFIQDSDLINRIDVIVSLKLKENVNPIDFSDKINALKDLFKFIKARSASINLFNDEIELPFEISEWKEIDISGKLLNHYKKAQFSKEEEDSKTFLDKNENKPIGSFLLFEKELKVPKNEISKKIAEYEAMANTHGIILNRFFEFLKARYPGKVFCESTKQNSRYRADIVRETDDKRMVLYEIKTYPTALTSIRIALGQLFEYAFYPTQDLSNELFIVSHVPATKDALLYLKHIGKKFGLTIEYIHFNMKKNEIEPNTL